ncbi:forkhead box protein P3a [Clupea harengus]|uniref:Forkhead box protein P3a n=1 Tax=Clupea harengus TaxID=7950 RepID=A0A6P8FBR3_CLUHA|nr:forkhead box protein P3a [Clupea harengus]
MPGDSSGLGMPHKGAEGSKGHGLGDQKPQLEKRNHRQHTAAESSTDHTETQFSVGVRSRGSIFTLSQPPSAHLPQSIGIKAQKQAGHLQMRQHRPTVLRRGHQPLPQDLSALSTECPDAVSKAESNQSSPRWPDSSCQKRSPPSGLKAAGSSQGSPKAAGSSQGSPKAAGSTQGSPERGFSSGSEAEPERSLFVKSVCRWPGCSQTLKESSYFLRHLCSEHGLGDRSLAEWRDQRERVQLMEKQLTLERKKLQEMQFHLHIFDHGATAESEGAERNPGDPSGMPQFKLPNGGVQGAMMTPTDLLTPGYLHIPTSQLMPGVIPTIDCYKYNNIRPPYTYADMIRWAVVESPEKQLALNEIYQWFMNMFHYFRHNTATWKNAVRHNLSLHKCFVRVEGVKGSVWTVDDAEFMRRKGQKIHRNQDVNWMPPYSFFYAQR